MTKKRVVPAIDARVLMWSAVGLALFSIVFSILVVVFEHRIDNFFSGFHERRGIGGTLQDFGFAGEYFNFVVGVPILLLGTLIAALASGIFAKYTSSRDEVTIFRFVENTMRPVSRSIRTLITSFADLVVQGNELIDFTQQFVKRLEAASKSDISHEASERPSASLESMTQAEKDGLNKLLEKIKDELVRWKTEYEKLLSSVYGALFARERITLVLNGAPGTAISYLRKIIPSELHNRVDLGAREPDGEHKRVGRQKINPDDPGDYPNDVREFLDNLIYYHKRTSERDTIRALSLLPSNSSTIEFLGATIFSPLLFLKTPIKHGWGQNKVTIEGYLVNVGAAWLLTLYQYIPDRVAISTAFEKIFDKRSAVAQNFVELAGPSPRDYIMFSIDDSIARQMKRFEQMIVVLTPEGPEFYDYDRHGPVVPTGYDD